MKTVYTIKMFYCPETKDFNIEGPEEAATFLAMLELAKLSLYESRQKSGKVGAIIQLPGVTG